MAKVKFYIGDDGREWFRMEVSQLEKPAGHVSPELAKEYSSEYEKFKQSLEAPKVVEESKGESDV